MKDLYKTICERIKADKDAKREERELMLDDQRFRGRRSMAYAD